MIQTIHYILEAQCLTSSSTCLMTSILTPIGRNFTYVFSEASLVYVQIDLSFLVFIDPFYNLLLVLLSVIRMLSNCQSISNSSPP